MGQFSPLHYCSICRIYCTFQIGIFIYNLCSEDPTNMNDNNFLTDTLNSGKLYTNLTNVVIINEDLLQACLAPKIGRSSFGILILVLSFLGGRDRLVASLSSIQLDNRVTYLHYLPLST